MCFLFSVHLWIYMGDEEVNSRCGKATSIVQSCFGMICSPFFSPHLIWERLTATEPTIQLLCQQTELTAPLPGKVTVPGRHQCGKAVSGPSVFCLTSYRRALSDPPSSPLNVNDIFWLMRDSLKSASTN